MPFETRAFYEIADRLQSGRPISPVDDATARTVAGRIYYAAFLATRDTLRRLNRNPTYDPGHERVADFLATYHDDADVQEIGQMLNGLRKRRTDADYFPDRTVTSRDVGLSMRDAKYVLDRQPLLSQRLDPRRFPVAGR